LPGGWRVPYLLGPIGIYIRRHIAETPEFAAIEPTRTPVRDLLRRHPVAIVLAIGASIIANSSFYVILDIPTYAIKQLRLPASTGFITTLVGAALLTVLCPIAGYWSDKIGRAPIMLVMAGLFLLTSYPVFALMIALPSLIAAVCAAGWLNLIKSAYSGVLPSLLAGLFPTETRGIGTSLSYSLSVTVFGGFAPLIATWLIATTGNPLSPSFYLIFTALLSMLALIVV
jgi:MHS family proline/betaine transporter-like MFS transporter